MLFALSTFIYFYGGWAFLTGLKDELKEEKSGMMTLITMAISVAYLYSTATVFGLEGNDFFWEFETLIDIMFLGHWIEMRSVLSASNALQKWAESMPNTAHLFKENGIEDINISELNSEDKILIKHWEKIPTNGVIIKGNSYLNESMLIGESRPVKKGKDDKFIGGYINGDCSLEIEVENIGEDLYL